jgi:hypothetical protein
VTLFNYALAWYLCALSSIICLQTKLVETMRGFNTLAIFAVMQNE